MAPSTCIGNLDLLIIQKWYDDVTGIPIRRKVRGALL